VKKSLFTEGLWLKLLLGDLSPETRRTLPPKKDVRALLIRRATSRQISSASG